MVKRSHLPVVTIGGGTGSSTLLRGLKRFTDAITAIVTVADDGGGSGILRRELGILPPGDARNCLFALANEENKVKELFHYRFNEGSLSGQSLGNLLVAALTDIYGSFDEGLRRAGEILAVTGKVVPMTLDNVALCAELEDGSHVAGESVLPSEVIARKSRIKRAYLDPPVRKTQKETVDAILEAKLILLGPGSLYTSLVPNLLVEEIGEAVRATDATVVYIANLMTQPGETDGFGVTEHLDVVETYLGEGTVDRIYVNDTAMTADIGAHYEAKHQFPVLMKPGEKERIEARGIRVVEGPYLDLTSGYVRHDAARLVEDLFLDTTRIYHG